MNLLDLTLLAPPFEVRVGIPPRIGGTWIEPARGIVWSEQARPIVWVEPSRGITWSATTMTTLFMRPGELAFYTMDLSALPELVAGDTIASINSITLTPLTVGASALTLTNQAITANLKGVRVEIGGAVTEANYRVRVSVTTTAGLIKGGRGILVVNDT